MLQNTLKAIFPIVAGTILLAACSSSKKAVATADRDDVKGTWVMDNISYDGLPQGQKIKLTLLDEGDENCLKGSTWVFPNNGNGSYTIAQTNATGCTPGERNIVWSYRQENGQTILQYKRLPGGVKAKDITDGYKFNIVSATDANLSLRSTVVYEGNTIGINYSFSKK
ncbi:MAG: lipocalin family protein [Chitinophagaceae bacterium]